MADDPLGDSQLPRQRGQLGVGREPAVRPAFDDPASFGSLRDQNPARPLLLLEHQDVGPRALQRQGGREACDPRPHDGDLQSIHPRPAAAVRTKLARHAISIGSSLSDRIRSRRTPSFRASSW